MYRITSRYLASSFIPPFMVGFIFFIAFLLTFYMLRIIDLIITKDVEIMIVLGMIISLSVTFFSLAAPLSAFFATIYTLNKLSDDSEIIAMRSFGVTKFKLFLPFLIVSFLMGFMIISLDSRYIPRANANFKNTIMKLTSKGMLTSIKSGQFFTDIPNTTLFAEGVNDEGDNFEKVFIHFLDKNSSEKRIIFAEKGSLVKLYANEYHAPSLRMHLTNGNIVKLNPEGSQVEKILFKEYDFPIYNSDFTSDLLDKDSMKTNSELQNVIDLRQKDYLEISRVPAKNQDEIDTRKRAKNLIIKSQIELYARFLTLPQIVVFVLLAFSFGIKTSRGGSGHKTITAVVIMLAYYAAYFLLVGLAQRETISALIASVIPCALLFIVSAFFYKKLEWIV